MDPEHEARRESPIPRTGDEAGGRADPGTDARTDSEPAASRREREEGGRPSTLDVGDRSTQIGLALVALGLLSLLGAFGVWDRIGAILRFFAFVVAGAVVLRLYGGDRSRVWTLPVGAGLIGLGIASVAAWGSGPGGTTFAGGAFLGSLGLGFVAIYLLDRERWWALLPAGVTTTLAVVASLGDVPGRSGAWTAATFFIGIGATFAVVAATGAGRRAWAWWPAAATIVVGVLQVSALGGWIVPAALIVAGAWMLLRDVERLRGGSSRGESSPGVSSPGESRPGEARPGV